MGSVHYLPPEQANGKGSTVKSDIYSLGILMYELLTGSVPFKGDTAVEIALKHMKEKIPSIRKQNPTIPQSVENIVLKATAKNPKNRYDNVRDMYKDLQTALQRDNEKRLVYEYPENDLEETKVIPQVTKEIKQVIDNTEAIKDIYEKMQLTFQKVGVNKYDAFHEMGGKLSFALCMLDKKDNGYVVNVMHSNDGCFAYIKEIVNGKSYIELGKEEEKAVKQALAGRMGDEELSKEINDLMQKDKM